MKRNNLLLNPYLLNLPILLILLIIISIFSNDVPLSDGIRYWETSKNFLDFFSNKKIIDSFLLTNGPIYPFVLSIFRFFGFTVKGCIFLNAIFLYFSSVFFFKSFSKFFNLKLSIFSCLAIIFIDPFLLYWTTKLYSEPLAILFASLFLYYFILVINSKSNSHLLLSSLFLALLALTRVIFGYVILSLTIIYFVLFILNSKSVKTKLILKLNFIALLFTIPYLIFTYNITGKPFYWSNNGGMLLYWISSPHKTDLGEWHVFGFDKLKDHLAFRYDKFSKLDSLHMRNVNDIIIDKIKSDHTPFLSKLKYSNPIELDSLLKEEALKNIIKDPTNFLNNWALNFGRLMIGYPHALYFKPPYSPLLSLINIIKSSFILFLIIGSIIYLIYNFFDKTLFRFVTLFIVIYIGGQSLLAVQSQRFLLPLYPFLIFIITSTFNFLFYKSKIDKPELKY